MTLRAVRLRPLLVVAERAAPEVLQDVCADLTRRVWGKTIKTRAKLRRGRRFEEASVYILALYLSFLNYNKLQFISNQVASKYCNTFYLECFNRIVAM